MATKQQLAQYCADHLPHPLFGVSTLTELIIGGVSVAVAFALGWYIKGRGMAGVSIDISNIKNDIINLKNKIDPPTVVVATPVSVPVVTATA